VAVVCVTCQRTMLREYNSGELLHIATYTVSCMRLGITGYMSSIILWSLMESRFFSLIDVFSEIHMSRHEANCTFRIKDTAKTFNTKVRQLQAKVRHLQMRYFKIVCK